MPTNTKSTTPILSALRLASTPPSETPAALIEAFGLDGTNFWSREATHLLAAIVVHLQYTDTAPTEALTFLRTHGPDPEAIVAAMKLNDEAMSSEAHDFLVQTTDAFLDHPAKTRAGVLATLLRMLRRRAS